MNVTTDGRPLTSIEAAILGLYMAGFTLAEFSHNEEYFLYLWVGDKCCVCGHQPGNHLAGIITPKEIDANHGSIEILPWLTAHGITPPEVEG